MFRGKQVAVFIDGCYWHGCPDHYVQSKSNRAYWNAKIDANKTRDAETTAILTLAGWIVLRFWTHTDPSVIAAAIQNRLRSVQ